VAIWQARAAGRAATAAEQQVAAARAQAHEARRQASASEEQLLLIRRQLANGEREQQVEALRSQQHAAVRIVGLTRTLRIDASDLVEKFAKGVPFLDDGRLRYRTSILVDDWSKYEGEFVRSQSQLHRSELTEAADRMRAEMEALISAIRALSKDFIPGPFRKTQRKRVPMARASLANVMNAEAELSRLVARRRTT
jgi:hypothetical protein